MITLLVCSLAHGLDPSSVDNPRARGAWITDAADLISADTEAAMEARLEALYQATGAELAVVTLPSVDHADPKQFATELLGTWGVGDGDRDDGVVVLLVLDARRVEVEVGYGLEASLPDSRIGGWLDRDVVPRFKEGAYGAGLDILVQRLDVEIRRHPATTTTTTTTSGPRWRNLLLAISGGLSALLALVALAVLAWRQRRKLERCPVCGDPILVLSEAEEDAHLTAGQQAEERVGSVEYTVRMCPRGHQPQILREVVVGATHRPCPSCHMLTWEQRTEMTKKPTTTEPGVLHRHGRCKSCGHEDTEDRPIPKIPTDMPKPIPFGDFGATNADGGGTGSCWNTLPSGMGGAFGGSSGGHHGGGSHGGGGHFGGGHSGGGGAGRSW